MRKPLMILAMIGLLGAGAAAADQRTAAAQAKLDKLLSGRVAGQSVKCLSSKKTNSPIGIDDGTILFRDGPRLWRNDLRGGLKCGELNGRKALMSEGAKLQVCSGTTLSIVDLDTGSATGGCLLGEFVPYTKP